ncbi:MAG: hypothetical protein OEZ36_07135 [Spirochaetota bacterium]|nr:hypothetical protein [Spirochaetota bacterium]
MNTKLLTIIMVATTMLISCGDGKPKSTTTSKKETSSSGKKGSSESFGKYIGGQVTNGGSITGVVKASQKADEIRAIKGDKLKAERDLCGASVPAEKFVIKNGNLKWAVAMLQGISKGKAIDKQKTITYDNVLCRFVPHVAVATKGSMLSIKNSDPVLHNSHLYLLKGGKKRTLVNLALPRKNQVISKTRFTRKTGLIEVLCDAHDFMQGYIWVLPHPYGAVTNDDGSFKLTDVPAGSYKLKVWHEALGEKVVSVDVKAGQDSKVTVNF